MQAALLDFFPSEVCRHQHPVSTPFITVDTEGSELGAVVENRAERIRKQGDLLPVIWGAVGALLGAVQVLDDASASSRFRSRAVRPFPRCSTMARLGLDEHRGCESAGVP